MTSTRTINRVLVANRGEIARRVFATARRLGIETVAVHSDADAGLPFVAEADRAVRLPGNTPAETYLRADLVIEAARRSGADAVHPGYGFLSENADFARAVLAAGLAWIGPAPESIVSMGSKIESKKLMEAAGVPVLPSWSQDEIGGRVASANERIETPLLVKASAGGGGRGMRIVRDLLDLGSEVEKASAEAAAAFGDGTVFVEPYVEHGRHIEVQVVGDASGTVAVFGERDCSIQRRHQKVVEEAPAPGLGDETRAALHEAARNAAAAIDYVGAGTVEFLVDAADPTRFWFLEMNTRLQVEHPVTEAIFGVDLVEAQIAVAEGRDVTAYLPGEPRGHAVEVRLYAEDPAADWQPQSGTLGSFEVPGVAAEFATPAGHGLRLDTGFVAGSEVGTHYDAMLAKVIVHAATREQALRQLAGALARARLHGLTTNRDLLVEVLRHPVFVAGDVSTDFLEVQQLASRSAGVDEALVQRSALAATVALAETAREARTVQRGIPVAWRNVVSAPQVTELTVDGLPADAAPVRVEWYGGRDGYQVDNGTVLAASATSVTLEHDGVATTYLVDVDRSGSLTAPVVHVDSPGGYVRLTRVPRFVDPSEQVATGSLLAPMPGSVISVAVEDGQQVAAGQTVLVMEAMKMQHTVTAPTDGVVTAVNVRPGQQVGAGDVLAVVESAEGEEA